ncbi:phosphopantetheine-binding protein [Streptomyces sp. NPDC058398]|uniref:phosphopantetheine-binding protein n=1 Tax=Streptomyces sp. NPDC058398 TaxID=3346479 RepID=UPI00365D4886
MTSEPTPPCDGHGDILAELTAVLARVVHADPDRVDPGQPFSVLGLDSLLTVEFVSAIEGHFGLRIAGADLYEYATPALLARHLAALRRGSGEAPAVQDSAAVAAVLQVLRHQLAQILHCDPWEIDGGAAFAQLGIDSILAADFAAGVNRAYGLSERPLTVHEHPSLASMAAYIASRTRGAPAPAAPEARANPPAAAPDAAAAAVPEAPEVSGVPAVPEAPEVSAVLSEASGVLRPAAAVAAVPGPPGLSRQEVLALLDAVRGDRIGVDEAAALLANRPA